MGAWVVSASLPTGLEEGGDSALSLVVGMNRVVWGYGV
jgi:hypothetical protein